jgi:hypothetical protein
MGRGDQDKRVRRAREQIEKALARRNLESAVDAVLAVDKTSREPLFTLLSPALRQTLPDLQKTSAWARLHTLAARAEQEPRLLLQGADEATAARARWPLFLACMRARDFARAGRIWKFLVDEVTARAPALARAIATWIEGQGQIAPHVVADLNLDGLPSEDAPNPRLGLETSGPPRLAPPVAPMSAAQAEDALYILFATQPLTVVADTLRTWLDRSPTDLAKVLRTRAGSLVMRELLLHAGSGDSFALPAQLLARLSEGAEDDLAQELLLATRFLMTTFVTKTPKRGEYESLAALAAALVRTNQFQDIAEILARDFARMPGLEYLALVICQSALSSAALPDERLISLWVQTLHLNASPPEVDAEDRFGLPGPTWLQAASREVCKRGRSLAAYLDKLDPPARSKMLNSLLWGQPSEIVADVVDALWKDASEELRRELAQLLPDLMEMAEDASLSVLSGSRSLADLATLNRIGLVAHTADPNLPFLAAGGLTLWRRFGLRSLPYFVELLPYALFQASQPSQRIEAVKAYVGNRTDIEAWLEAIRELSEGDSSIMPSLVVETSRMMFDRFRDDRIALARAIDYTIKLDAPIDLVKTLAHAYQRAALAEDGPDPTPEDARAQAVLALMFGSKAKESPAKHRTKRARKASRRPKSPSGQLALPLDENDP